MKCPPLLHTFFLYVPLLLFTNLLTYYLTFSPTSFLVPNSTTTASGTTETVLTCAPPDPSPVLPEEFTTFASPMAFPLGRNPNTGTDHLNPPVGHPCTLFPSDLRTYMSYRVNASCPDDELLAQRLLLRGCEPLPRRRCRAAAPRNYVEPRPLPESLWTVPPDETVVWTAYSCKNYGCLVGRKKQKGFDDCKDCFDLAGREKSRWVVPSNNALDFTIDDVLKLKPPGTIRIGLDIGGGVGTFAVRMRERNVTVLTTSMNLNGPFNSFIASRGVIPLYMSISQRLPFFDNTLDLVHSMHVLSNWIPTTLLHFLLFDVYRVLRPGGIFWLDHFFFLEEQLGVYAGLIDSVGFRRARWVIGSKLDRGPQRREMYISAVLEKPLKNSW